MPTFIFYHHVCHIARRVSNHGVPDRSILSGPIFYILKYEYKFFIINKTELVRSDNR